MEQKDKASEHKRRDWVIILIILLVGFLCVIIAGEQAVRFAPRWRLDASMESNIDPDSDFLTSRPVNLFEPLDPSILTQPAWINVFLTPGASYETSSPIPTVANKTPIISTPTAKPTTTMAPTSTMTTIVNPTNSGTVVPPITKTSIPTTSADLRITKTDNVTTYSAYSGGNTVTYIIVVSNDGPKNITGAVVSDPKPSQVTTWSWACTSQNNGANGCNTMLGNTGFNDIVNLPSGASIVYTVTTNIAIGSTGDLVNTASVSMPAGSTDLNNGNNSATDIDTLFVPAADLRITKDDGVLTYTVGGSVTYMITVSNPTGPNGAVNATVTDNTLTTATNANIASASWTCSGTNGGTCIASGSGNINDSTVDLPIGSSVTYIVKINISAAATGNLANTASVSVPPGYSDPNTSNNSDTDTDTLFVPVSVDLGITKTDNTTTYTAYSGGNTVTYTIVVSNNSTNAVIGAVVSDAKPTQVTNWSWACTSQSNGANGCDAMLGNVNFADTVNLPGLSSITYTVTATIAIGSSGDLVNTASVTVPVGYNDINNLNDSAIDIDTYLSAADLGITKTDGSTTYPVGGSVTYTIIVKNDGPDNVTGATISDPKPAQITNWGWCVAPCTPVKSSTTTLSDTLNLASGSSITYTVFADIEPNATGNMTNTASVAVPGSYIDPVTANNSVSDIDTPVFNVDLQITKTDGVVSYIPGTAVTYTMVITNAGPADAANVTVTDTFPVQVSSVSWSCASTGAATCTTTGTGDISDKVNIPVGGSLEYTAVANISSSSSGNLSNTATISLPGGYINIGNNSATDTDTCTPSADLRITKTDNSTDYTSGIQKIYAINVFNDGPSDVTAASVTDMFSTNINIDYSSVIWVCLDCSPVLAGTGDINQAVNIPSGSSVTFYATARVVSNPSGSLENTAKVDWSSGYDPNTSNNTATDTDTLFTSVNFPSGNIGLTPDNNVTVIPSGGSITLALPSTLTVGAHPSFDLIYYELANGSGIALDWVQLQIGDGSNWYTILNWGDGSADTNTNMNINVIGGSESDNRDFTSPPDSDILYPFNSGTLANPSTGVTIDLEGFVPNGNYYFIRIISPLGDDGDGVEVDAIYIVP